VQQTLNVLESYPMRDLGHNSADYSHLVASALNLNPLVTASESSPAAPFPHKAHLLHP